MGTVLVLLNGCGSDTSNAQSDAAGNGPVQLFAIDGDYAGSHILIAYSGAMRADSAVSRTKEEALQKAADLIDQLKEDPSKFEELARSESDGPTGPEGGDLGAWPKGRMVAEFDTAIEGLEIGGITAEPVETAFGYHVIRRNEIPKMAYYSADAFIVGYAGLPQTPPTVTRDSTEAATLVDEIAGELTGDNFDELLAQYNDFGEGATSTGIITEEQPGPPGLLDLLRDLDYGEAGGPVTLPVGFAFVRRLELDRRAGAHILFAYAGAMRASEDNTRSKEEALAEATRVLDLVKANPDSFAELAGEHSDDPSAAENGGNLGTWFKGMMVPQFDEAIDGLSVGEMANEPVETPFGYHLIMRKAVD